MDSCRASLVLWYLLDYWSPPRPQPPRLRNPTGVVFRSGALGAPNCQNLFNHLWIQLQRRVGYDTNFVRLWPLQQCLVVQSMLTDTRIVFQKFRQTFKRARFPFSFLQGVHNLLILWDPLHWTQKSDGVIDPIQSSFSQNSYRENKIDNSEKLVSNIS